MCDTVNITIEYQCPIATDLIREYQPWTLSLVHIPTSGLKTMYWPYQKAIIYIIIHWNYIVFYMITYNIIMYMIYDTFDTIFDYLCFDYNSYPDFHVRTFNSRRLHFWIILEFCLLCHSFLLSISIPFIFVTFPGDNIASSLICKLYIYNMRCNSMLI